MNKMRPELSKKNPYWISRYRYYELRYFCMQYNEWRQKYNELQMCMSPGRVLFTNGNTNNVSDKTASIAIQMAELRRKMELVEQSCIEADSELHSYIFQGVTLSI